MPHVPLSRIASGLRHVLAECHVEDDPRGRVRRIAHRLENGLEVVEERPEPWVDAQFPGAARPLLLRGIVFRDPIKIRPIGLRLVLRLLIRRGLVFARGILVRRRILRGDASHRRHGRGRRSSSARAGSACCRAGPHVVSRSDPAHFDCRLLALGVRLENQGFGRGRGSGRPPCFVQSPGADANARNASWPAALRSVIESIDRRNPDLEEVFLRIVRGEARARQDVPRSSPL